MVSYGKQMVKDEGWNNGRIIEEMLNDEWWNNDQ